MFTTMIFSQFRLNTVFQDQSECGEQLTRLIVFIQHNVIERMDGFQQVQVRSQHVSRQWGIVTRIFATAILAHGQTAEAVACVIVISAFPRLVPESSFMYLQR